MTNETPMPPQDVDPEEIVAEEPERPSEDAARNNVPDEDGAPSLDDMTYEQYLKLTNPGKSDEEIAQMIRKENRYIWMTRIQIVALIVIFIVVICFIFTS